MQMATRAPAAPETPSTTASDAMVAFGWRLIRLPAQTSFRRCGSAKCCCLATQQMADRSCRSPGYKTVYQCIGKRGMLKMFLFDPGGGCLTGPHSGRTLHTVQACFARNSKDFFRHHSTTRKQLDREQTLKLIASLGRSFQNCSRIHASKQRQSILSSSFHNTAAPELLTSHLRTLRRARRHVILCAA